MAGLASKTSFTNEREQSRAFAETVIKSLVNGIMGRPEIGKPACIGYILQL